MRKFLVSAAFVAVPFTAVPASAQGICTQVSTCEQARTTCIALRNAGQPTPDCEKTASTCVKTCIWNGTFPRPYSCRMPPPCTPK